jgi:hypothetical protein
MLATGTLTPERRPQTNEVTLRMVGMLLCRKSMLTSRSTNDEGSISTKCLRERIHIDKHLFISTLRKREREGVIN